MAFCSPSSEHEEVGFFSVLLNSSVHPPRTPPCQSVHSLKPPQLYTGCKTGTSFICGVSAHASKVPETHACTHRDTRAHTAEPRGIHREHAHVHGVFIPERTLP